MNRDRMTNAQARTVAVAAHAVVDRLQNFAPEDQALGLAGAFVLLCERLGVRPTEALDIIARMRRDAETCAPFGAVEMYLKYEI